MQDKLGETFDGVITSVTAFGLFVELDEVHIDGLVHITALHNDFYHFDPIGHRLHGERTGTVYRLGDRLRVQVAAVNLDDRKIDFVLAESKGPGRRGDKTASADSSEAARQDSADGGKRSRGRGRRKRKPAGTAPAA
jgi:ribonuclease R